MKNNQKKNTPCEYQQVNYKNKINININLTTGKQNKKLKIYTNIQSAINYYLNIKTLIKNDK